MSVTASQGGFEVSEYRSVVGKKKTNKELKFYHNFINTTHNTALQ